MLLFFAGSSTVVTLSFVTSGSCFQNSVTLSARLWPRKKEREASPGSRRLMMLPCWKTWSEHYAAAVERLRAIDRLVTRLEAGNGSDADPVPTEFRALWDAFRVALQNEGADHVG